MLNKLNEFFSIESKDQKQRQKARLHRNTRMEEYRSEIM
jgi:hypothetical protein